MGGHQSSPFTALLINSNKERIMFCQNLCIFSGRLGGDPEATKVGDATVWKMGLAVDAPRKTDEGWESNTSWVDLELWENVDGYGAGKGIVVRKIKKGDVIHVHTSYRKVVKDTDNGKRSYVTFRVLNIYPEESARRNGTPEPQQNFRDDRDPFEAE